MKRYSNDYLKITVIPLGMTQRRLIVMPSRPSSIWVLETFTSCWV